MKRYVLLIIMTLVASGNAFAGGAQDDGGSPESAPRSGTESREVADGDTQGDSQDTAGPLRIVGVNKIGGFDSALGEGAAEIVAHSAEARRIYVVNAAQTSVDIVDIADPTRPELVRHIEVGRYGASANSVAVHGNYLAVAVEAEEVDGRGTLLLMDLDGEVVASFEAGVLPDMVTFTPDGRYLLSANEGEPSDDYTVDPEGSITVVDLSSGFGNATVRTAGFDAFNGERAALVASGVRIFGPGASVAQDLEPEYIAVSDDSRTAWVSLQENNAVAIVDITSARVRAVAPLGFKDYSLGENELDTSDRDGEILFRTAPVLGMYQPDAIAAITIDGRQYLLSANEGDARDYDGYSEETRIADLALDSGAYPDATAFGDDAVFGRLRTTDATGDTDGDGDIDQIYVYGARSMTVWAADGDSLSIFADTGAELERAVARLTPDGFNANDGLVEEFDARSDDKGPEPEAVVTGIVGGRPYAFLGLERALGGFVVWDISDPAQPAFVEYVLSNDGSGDAGNDISPEGMVFIPADESPNGEPLVVVSYELSGTVAIYEIETR